MEGAEARRRGCATERHRDEAARNEVRQIESDGRASRACQRIDECPVRGGQCSRFSEARSALQSGGFCRRCCSSCC